MKNIIEKLKSAKQKTNQFFFDGASFRLETTHFSYAIKSNVPKIKMGIKNRNKICRFSTLELKTEYYHFWHQDRSKDCDSQNPKNRLFKDFSIKRYFETHSEYPKNKNIPSATEQYYEEEKK